MAILAKETEYLLSSYQIRAYNLREYAKRFKSDKEFAKKLGISPVRLHCLIRKENQPITEKMARAIEQKLGCSLGVLDLSSDREEEHKVPIYVFEDLRDIENAKPANHIYYKTSQPNAYFIQILNKVYEPHIPMGAKVLINPSNKTLSNGNLFLVGYEIEGVFRPLIRLCKNSELVDLVTSEVDHIKNYKIYGACETVISTLHFG